MVSDFEIFLDKISSAINQQSPRLKEKSKNKRGLMKRKSKKAGKTLSAEADPLTASCASKRIHRAEGAIMMMSELTSVFFPPAAPVVVLPSTEEYISTLQKIKYGFNLLVNPSPILWKIDFTSVFYQ